MAPPPQDRKGRGRPAAARQRRRGGHTRDDTHECLINGYESPQWKAFVRAQETMRTRDEARLRAFELVDLDVLIEVRKVAGSRGSRSGGGDRSISATELQRGFIDAMVRAGEEGTDPGPISYTRTNCSRSKDNGLVVVGTVHFTP